jgi:hypothetical protein
VGESEVDEPLEVDGGDAVAEPELVAVGAAVAESAAGARNGQELWIGFLA